MGMDISIFELKGVMRNYSVDLEIDFEMFTRIFTLN